MWGLDPALVAIQVAKSKRAPVAGYDRGNRSAFFIASGDALVNASLVELQGAPAFVSSGDFKDIMKIAQIAPLIERRSSSALWRH